MHSEIFRTGHAIAIQRLTALWALNECGLGGFLHAINSPFTGLLVGSIAMLCIAGICFFAENKWQTVMASLVIVLIIKGLVSPHSTPTAYIAVTFQAVTGALIYRSIPNLAISSILFATLGLLESAFQRLLTLAILYGNPLWKAIDMWGSYVTTRWNMILPLPTSQMMIIAYVLIYFLSGIIVGWMIYRLLNMTMKKWNDPRFQVVLNSQNRRELFSSSGYKKKWKRWVAFLLLMMMIILAYIFFDEKNSFSGLIAIARAILLLTLWFLFIGPWIMKRIQRYLDKKHQHLASQISATMDVFPYLLWILDITWKETSHLAGFRRVKTFVSDTFMYILQFRTTDDTYPDRPDAKS